jgi:hypothetical protein
MLHSPSNGETAMNWQEEHGTSGTDGRGRDERARYGRLRTIVEVVKAVAWWAWLVSGGAL